MHTQQEMAVAESLGNEGGTYRGMRRAIVALARDDE